MVVEEAVGPHEGANWVDEGGSEGDTSSALDGSGPGRGVGWLVGVGAEDVGVEGLSMVRGGRGRWCVRSASNGRSNDH